MTTASPTQQDLVDELNADIAKHLTLDADQATERLLIAAKHLWEALVGLGLANNYASAECRRTLPRALAFIQYEANCYSDAPPYPGALDRIR